MFNVDISNWNIAKVTRMYQSTSHSTEHCLCFLSLGFYFSHTRTSILLLFSFHFSLFRLDQTNTACTPTAFKDASAFNVDLSKWNTAKVLTMYKSTSTPPLFHSVRCFLRRFLRRVFCSLNPSFSLFSFLLPQHFSTVVSHKPCAVANGHLCQDLQMHLVT